MNGKIKSEIFKIKVKLQLPFELYIFFEIAKLIFY